MEIDYTKDDKVKFNMSKYVENMLDDFPQKFKSTEVAKTPAGGGLFHQGQGGKLSQERADIYHTTVARGLFLCKRARPDLQPTIAVLCMRIKEPNEADWAKLIRLMKYLNGTRKKKLIQSADDIRCIKWYVDASFAVHPQVPLCHSRRARGQYNQFQENRS
jgi:hypothetical protein